MTNSSALERRYLRILAWYPRAFRREHEQEILAVLMASALKCQRRPGLGESADLIKSALWMRLRPGAPRSVRTVFAAVRLMYVGAAIELIALITILATADSVKSTIAERYPHLAAMLWHAVWVTHIVPDVVAAPIAIGLWLWMAWANGRGHNWARLAFALFFASTTLSLLVALIQDAAVYAPADLVAGIGVWLVGLAAVLLIFNGASRGYYIQDPDLAVPNPDSRARSAASFTSP
ncbi:MAG: hypothetical protein WA751_05530 [Candidatus Dormiibacterota bacterium]